MKVVNVGYIPGEVIIDVLDLVHANLIVNKPLKERLKNKDDINFDDEIKDAKNIMIEKAKKLNADAIVNTTYEIDPISKSLTSITLYGTAVKFKR